MQSHLYDFEKLGVEPPIVEGFVFLWHDKPYKMTGAFASMNRVVGVPRYGLGLQFSAEELAQWREEQK